MHRLRPLRLVRELVSITGPHDDADTGQVIALLVAGAHDLTDLLALLLDLSLPFGHLVLGRLEIGSSGAQLLGEFLVGLLGSGELVLCVLQVGAGGCQSVPRTLQVVGGTLRGALGRGDTVVARLHLLAHLRLFIVQTVSKRRSSSQAHGKGNSQRHRGTRQRSSHGGETARDTRMSVRKTPLHN